MARKSKKELDAARELAFILFINHVTQKEIAERVCVSQQTISEWVNKDNWEQKRAAKTVTRTELINKTLEQISNILESTDGKLSAADADKMVKLAALIERLDKKNSPVVAIEVFIQFIGYIQNNAAFDKELDIDFIKKVNKYQDAFVTTLMSEK